MPAPNPKGHSLDHGHSPDQALALALGPQPLRVPNPNPFATPKTSDWALGALGKPALRGPHTLGHTHCQPQTLTATAWTKP